MSDKAAGQKVRSPEGCDQSGPAAALLLSHVSIQIWSFYCQSGADRLASGPFSSQPTTPVTDLVH
jgi:hypothetical protein